MSLLTPAAGQPAILKVPVSSNGVGRRDEARLERSGRRDQLERRAGRVLALDRVVVLCAARLQRREVGRRDPAHPFVEVVVGVRGERQHLAVLGVHDDGGAVGRGRQLAAVDRVRRLPVAQDLLLQIVLDRLLEAGVDVEHDGVADLRSRRAEGADNSCRWRRPRGPGAPARPSGRARTGPRSPRHRPGSPGCTPGWGARRDSSMRCRRRSRGSGCRWSRPADRCAGRRSARSPRGTPTGASGGTGPCPGSRRPRRARARTGCTDRC